MKLSNQKYNYLKVGVTVVLPALGTAYGAIATAWCLPYTEPILTTIAAITACGSAIINGISKQYHKNKEE